MTPTQRPLRTLYGSTRGSAPFRIESAAFSDDGTSLWLQGRDEAQRVTVGRLDLADGSLGDRQTLPLEDTSEHRTAFLRGGDRLVVYARRTTAGGALVGVWDLAAKRFAWQSERNEVRELVGCLVGRSCFTLLGMDDRAAVYDAAGDECAAMDSVLAALAAQH